MSLNQKKRFLVLCLLFSVGTGFLSAQQYGTAHLHFLHRLAGGVACGEMEGKNIKQYMFEERIAILEGDISMLNSLLADTSVLTEISIVDGKRCAASFYRDSLRVFTISYPANYQLVWGITMMEAEERLSEGIRATQIPPVESELISKDVLTQQKNSSIYVKKGSSYIVPELNSNRYYVAVKKDKSIGIDSLLVVSVERTEIDGNFDKGTNSTTDDTDSSTIVLNKKNECWLLTFFRRIFGCYKHSPESERILSDTISLVKCINQDSLVYEDHIMLVDSLSALEDSIGFELLYSEDMPVESMANLVTGNNIDDSINIDIILVKYGYRTEQFEVPLRQLIAFCLAEGCQPYFGVIGQDDNEVVCELIMLNELFGYAHVMKLTFNPVIISLRKGIVSARLNSYVPIGNLKSLFDEEK